MMFYAINIFTSTSTVRNYRSFVSKVVLGTASGRRSDVWYTFMQALQLSYCGWYVVRSVAKLIFVQDEVLFCKSRLCEAAVLCKLP